MTIAIALLIALAGCQEQRALVREISSTGTYDLPVSLLSATGRRDGYQISAAYEFGDEGGTRLVVELELHVDPQPVLDAGAWRYEGPTGRSAGDVLPQSLQFAGGQGDGMSLGGRWLLREDGTPRFEVDVPPTLLAPSGPR